MNKTRLVRDITGAAALTAALFLGPLGGAAGMPEGESVGSSFVFAGHVDTRAPVFVDVDALLASTSADDLQVEDAEEAEVAQDGDAELASDTARPGPALPIAEGAKGWLVAGEGGSASVGEAVHRPRRSKRCLEPDTRIVNLDATEWQVERSILAEYTKSIPALNTLGWVSRHEGDDGRVDGLIVRGIKCGSPLHAGGLRSGDVVQRVNGKQVKSLLGGVALYAKQHKRELFVVEVERKGQPLSLVYRVI